MKHLLSYSVLGLILVAPNAMGEALSTTSTGLAIRNITYTPEQDINNTDPTNVNQFESKQQEEKQDSPIICQRVSTPSSLGLEIGAGGCVQSGGENSVNTFAHSISAHFQLIYYPLASRTQINDDASLRLKRQFLGDFYLIGQGGFAKVTYGESTKSDFSYSMDIAEFGGGIGWTYRLFSNVALGLEGTYLVGSILSTEATGSTNITIASALVTVFL